MHQDVSSQEPVQRRPTEAFGQCKTIMKMAELTEQRLERDGLTEEANKVFQANVYYKSQGPPPPSGARGREESEDQS